MAVDVFARTLALASLGNGGGGSAVDTYTKAEIDKMFGDAGTVQVEAVDALPTEDIKENVIYLVPNGSEGTNYYDECMYINNKWEVIGNTSIDLSAYATKEELEAAMAEVVTQDILANYVTNETLLNYATKEELETATAEQVTQEMLADYATKDELPSVEGLATEEYVNEAMANVGVGLVQVATVGELPSEGNSNTVYYVQDINELRFWENGAYTDDVSSSHFGNWIVKIIPYGIKNADTETWLKENVVPYFKTRQDIERTIIISLRYKKGVYVWNGASGSGTTGVTNHVFWTQDETMNVREWSSYTREYNTQYIMTFSLYDKDFTCKTLEWKDTTIKERHYLDTDTNYSSPYMPTRPGSPATKKYVDDTVETKQNKLTAGANITIDENNVISATGGGSSDVSVFEGTQEEYDALTDEQKEQYLIAVIDDGGEV